MIGIDNLSELVPQKQEKLMKRLLSRAGSLLWISLCCFCLVSTAKAQYDPNCIFIDAPDDTTWIDTSYHPNQDSKNASGQSTALFSPTLTAVTGFSHLRWLSIYQILSIDQILANLSPCLQI